VVGNLDANKNSLAKISCCRRFRDSAPQLPKSENIYRVRVELGKIFVFVLISGKNIRPDMTILDNDRVCDILEFIPADFQAHVQLLWR
jgi:hypothetical protein